MEFLGSLYVFVDSCPKSEVVPSPTEPDDVFGAGEPGGRLWYLSGWAVGKSDRGNYCARTSTAKLRTFGTFAEAMDFVRKKRKARIDERFSLVYEIDGRKTIVTSLEQIHRLDGRFNGDNHRAHGQLGRTPELDALAEKVGKVVATNALIMLRMLIREGEAATKARFSGATYERLWRVLWDAGLVEGRCAQP